MPEPAGCYSINGAPDDLYIYIIFAPMRVDAIYFLLLMGSFCNRDVWHYYTGCTG